MAKRGRPPIFNDVKQGALCAMVAHGCPIFIATAYVGVNPRTVRYARKNNRAFATQLRIALISGRLLAPPKLKLDGRTSWRASALHLEHVRARRRRRPSHQVGGGDIIAKLIKGITDAVREKTRASKALQDGDASSHELAKS